MVVLREQRGVTWGVRRVGPGWRRRKYAAYIRRRSNGNQHPVHFWTHLEYLESKNESPGTCTAERRRRKQGSGGRPVVKPEQQRGRGDESSATRPKKRPQVNDFRPSVCPSVELSVTIDIHKFFRVQDSSLFPCRGIVTRVSLTRFESKSGSIRLPGRVYLVKSVDRFF